MTLLLTLVLGCASFQRGTLGDESWTVERRVNRVSYFTHGTTVWGHEFGFLKAGDCKNDILWLTFSARDEKVKDFDNKDILISLTVDKKDYRIEVPMMYMGVIGFTHVMYFTNWVAEEELLGALMKGRHAKVRILEPKELEALLDIKEDRFGLKGFVASREEAERVCKSILSDARKDR